MPHHTAESKVDGMREDHKIFSEQYNSFFFSNFGFSVFMFYPSTGMDTKLPCLFVTIEEFFILDMVLQGLN